jgi:hypothetical protein
MIRSDQELAATQDRIRHFQAQVCHLRRVENNPSNYRLSASGFLAEIDRMQLEVREYPVVAARGAVLRARRSTREQPHLVDRTRAEGRAAQGGDTRPGEGGSIGTGYSRVMAERAPPRGAELPRLRTSQPAAETWCGPPTQ